MFKYGFKSSDSLYLQFTVSKLAQIYNIWSRGKPKKIFFIPRFQITISLQLFSLFEGLDQVPVENENLGRRGGGCNIGSPFFLATHHILCKIFETVLQNPQIVKKTSKHENYTFLKCILNMQIFSNKFVHNQGSCAN